MIYETRKSGPKMRRVKEKRTKTRPNEDLKTEDAIIFHSLRATYWITGTRSRFVAFLSYRNNRFGPALVSVCEWESVNRSMQEIISTVLL